MCQKQCRDEHGFKCHCSSESHMRMMKLFAENADHFINAHSNEFHSEFMKLLQQKKVIKQDANQLYQEYILDPEHMHLNATKWSSLTDYVMWLGKEGHARVEQVEDGFLISYIDRSGVTAMQEKQKKVKIEKSEEERSRLEIQKQILNSQNVTSTSVKETVPLELKREDDKPIKLELKSLALKKPTKVTKLSKLFK